MSNTNASNLNINKIVDTRIKNNKSIIPVRGASNRLNKQKEKQALAKQEKINRKAVALKAAEDALFLFCYQNEIHFDQYNQYHFRLFLNGNMLDVWPTSKKYWGRRMSASKVYKDPRELLEYLQ